MFGVSVIVGIDVLKDFLEDFKIIGQTVEAGLVATGPAAAYAEVWEWGNARQTKQGPKTVLGVNPDGETVWLSTQAPTGYIAIHTDKYIEIVKMQLNKLEFSRIGNLKDVARDSMAMIADVVSDNAPVDSGQLRDCFRVVEDGDSVLDDDPGGTIESRFTRVRNI